MVQSLNETSEKQGTIREDSFKVRFGMPLSLFHPFFVHRPSPPFRHRSYLIDKNVLYLGLFRNQVTGESISGFLGMIKDKFQALHGAEVESAAQKFAFLRFGTPPSL